MTDGFATRAIHEGQEFDPTTGAIIPPIYQTSTFVQDGVGGLRGEYEYGRSGNPTRSSLETLIASLEGGKRGLSFASGLAAEDALLRAVLPSGVPFVLGNGVYCGAHRVINRIRGALGILITAVEWCGLEAVRTALSADGTHALWIEPSTNLLMKISDMTALAELGHEVA